MVTIEVNSEVSAKKWLSFVENYAHRAIYHFPQWQEVQEDSFHHKPVYVCLRLKVGLQATDSSHWHAPISVALY